ncbi:MAG: SMC-Scp complex subunit ScpB [Cytophagales bacterium]
MDYLQNHLESIIFCAEKPVSLADMQLCMQEMFESEIPLEHIENAVNQLIKKYEGDDFSFGIFNIANGYLFLTKPAYQSSLSIFFKQSSKKRLSHSAIETLAIIAYKQPISKTQIEQIRGVSCDYSVQKLLEKELIEIKGKSDAVGRPLLYGTNEKFLDYFGINKLSDLPQPKDFASLDNEIGNQGE